MTVKNSIQKNEPDQVNQKNKIKVPSQSDLRIKGGLQQDIHQLYFLFNSHIARKKIALPGSFFHIAY